MLLDADGRPLDSATLMREYSYRADGWQNGLTGIGTAADKTTAGRFLPSFRLLDQEIRALRDSGDIAPRMVEDAPNEMFREGYDLIGRIRKEKKSGSPTDAADDVLESDANDLRQWCEEEFGLDEQAHAAVIEGRYWGGSLLVMGIDDGGMPWEPVNEDRIESLDFLSLVDRRYAFVQSQYSNMLSRQGGRYGTAEIYLVSNAIASSGWNDYGPVRKRSQRDIEGAGGMISFLHSSRALRFDGNPADVQSRQRLAGWSWSIFQRVYSAIRSFEHAFDSSMYLLSDASQGVLKIFGLFKAISAGQKQAIQDRALLFDQQRSTIRSILLDAGNGKDAGESFERQPTTFAGVSDLLDRFMMRLSAATPEREPVTLLFGRSPQGLSATGDAEIRMWYDAVRAKANKTVAPRLRTAYRIAALAKNSPMKGKKVDWKVVWKPLWSPTSKELEDALLARAQRDVALTDAAIVSPEVASLTWKDEYPALPVREIEEALEAKQSFDPHEGDPEDPPETFTGAGEPLGQGAPIPTLGPSVSPEAGGIRQPKPTGGPGPSPKPGGARTAPGAPTSAKKPSAVLPPKTKKTPPLPVTAQPAPAKDAVDASDIVERWDSDDIADDVYAQLAPDYPEKAIGWVHAVPWKGPQTVKLSDIDDSGREHWRASKDDLEPYKAKIKAGQLKPIVLIDRPGKKSLLPADGHHRFLAYEALGRAPVAYVAKVAKDAGPWDSLHAQQSDGTFGSAQH